MGYRDLRQAESDGILVFATVYRVVFAVGAAYYLIVMLGFLLFVVILVVLLAYVWCLRPRLSRKRK